MLFVAEKMAALEVVKRRLDKQCGLGDMCLELHSNKANKRLVLEELGKNTAIGTPANRWLCTASRTLEGSSETSLTRMFAGHALAAQRRQDSRPTK